MKTSALLLAVALGLTACAGNGPAIVNSDTFKTGTGSSNSSGGDSQGLLTKPRK